MDWVVDLVSAIRSVRSEMNVPPSARLTVSVKDADEKANASLETHRALIEANARLKCITVADGAIDISGAVQTVFGSMTLVLPLAGVIDLDQERARLQKEISKLDSAIGKIEQKLGNEGFLAKAPPEVVEENREKKRSAEEARNKVQDALNRIQAA